MRRSSPPPCASPRSTWSAYAIAPARPRSASRRARPMRWRSGVRGRVARRAQPAARQRGQYAHGCRHPGGPPGDRRAGAVRRIVGWYKRGLTPEEITTEVPHLSLAQVYAALTYYHANREEIEADIAAEEAEAQHLEMQQAPQRNTP